MAETFAPLPECFKETDSHVDYFLQEELSVEAFDDYSEDVFLAEKASFAEIPLADDLVSSYPSDVSSDGSGCFELPCSEAGDEGGSLACGDASASDAAAGVTCSGESSRACADVAPDEAAASCEKQQFVLVRLDIDGRYMRTANEEDMQLLVKLLNASEAPPLIDHPEPVSVAPNEEAPAPAEVVAPPPVPSAPPPPTTGGQRKPGGPCCHCGATESPQWRRGPAIKPVLCNACGTRFRRTNQLGVAIPSYLKDKSRGAAAAKKRAAPPHPEPDAPAPKQPRAAGRRHSAASRAAAALAA